MDRTTLESLSLCNVDILVSYNWGNSTYRYKPKKTRVIRNMNKNGPSRIVSKGKYMIPFYKS